MCPSFFPAKLPLFRLFYRCANPVYAMPNSGNLNVEITTLEKYVKIEVIDTGEGIPPENIAKIFEPYFSTKETGKIGVKSSESTKFAVKIPIA